MAATKQRTKPLKAAIGLCGVILRAGVRIINEPDLRAVVGTKICRTLSEVAREFGVSHNTIKTSWRPEGMPGKQGRYPLLEILLWRLRYLAELEGRKATTSELSNAQLEREQHEEELRKIRLQNDKLEREEQVAIGKLIPRDAATTVFNAAVNTAVERVLKVPATFEPRLPKNIAAEFVADQERSIRREFTALSEALARNVLREQVE